MSSYTENIRSIAETFYVKVKGALSELFSRAADPDDPTSCSCDYPNSYSDDSGNRKPVAVLDLDGGSTQLTFSPKSQAESFHNSMYKVNISGTTVNVFTHSYSGLGWQATRMSILLQGKERGENNHASGCIHPGIHATPTEYQGKKCTSGGGSTKNT